MRFYKEKMEAKCTFFKIAQLFLKTQTLQIPQPKTQVIHQQETQEEAAEQTKESSNHRLK